jgi:hypothetical protein
MLIVYSLTSSFNNLINMYEILHERYPNRRHCNAWFPQISNKNVVKDAHKIELCITLFWMMIECSWNMMAHGDAREGTWRGIWLMEWVASTLHITTEHCVSSITTITTLAASSRLNWRPRRFKWTRPFGRKTESSFCACATTFQTQSTTW